MNERDLKLTDLDYAIADHHVQMLKAAIPYMEIPQQRNVSMIIKLHELIRTMDFFQENDLGMMSVCSLDQDHTSAPYMLEAVRPYANQKEQELIDMMTRILSNRQNRTGRSPITLEQILSIMPQEQQSKFETLQMMMQALGQF